MHAAVGVIFRYCCYYINTN